MRSPTVKSWACHLEQCRDADGRFDCVDPSCSGAAVCGTPDAGTVDSGVDSGVDAGSRRVGADALWQVRCSSGAAGCAEPGMIVDLTSFDGDDGVNVSCSLENIAGGNRLVSVEIIANATQRLRLENLVISDSGDAVGAGMVQIVDGDLDLSGDAQAAAPTESVPCQVSSMEFRELEEGPAMSFTLLCRGIHNPASPETTGRDLSFPGMLSMPASITVFNCAGL